MLLDCYAQEVEKIAEIRVAIVDQTRSHLQCAPAPSLARTADSKSAQEVVAERMATLLQEPFATGHREQIP